MKKFKSIEELNTYQDRLVRYCENLKSKDPDFKNKIKKLTKAFTDLNKIRYGNFK